MPDLKQQTLIACLREVAKMLPRGAELDAFLQNMNPVSPIS